MPRSPAALQMLKEFETVFLGGNAVALEYEGTDSWTWLGLYAAIAMVGGIVATNIMRTIERQSELTRQAIDDAVEELCEKLDEVTLESRRHDE
jgi:hypothetical protein